MKKIKVLSLVMVVILTLTACMKEDAQVKVLSNGYVTMDATIDIQKESMDKVLKEMNVSPTDLDPSMKEVTIDGVQYYEMKETEKKTYKEFMDEDEDKGTYVSKDTFYVSSKATASSAGDADELQQLMEYYGLDSASMEDMIITYSIEFEQDIVRTNGTIDENNPKKANFVIKGNENTSNYTVFATTNANVTEQSVIDKIKAANANTNVTDKKTTDKSKASNTIGKPKLKKVKANKVKKKAKKATITVKFSKVSGAEKYKVQYSTKKNFKKSKTKTTKKTSYTIKNLKKGTRYYIRVYAVKKKLVSKASNKKSVKTKK